MFQQNASKFSMLYVSKNHVVFFVVVVVHFVQLYFFPCESPDICQHRPEHSYLKRKIVQNEKKTVLVFLCVKYSKFWSITVEHFIKHKILISEEFMIIEV